MCSIHLRTKEELDYWREKDVDLDKIRCDGCRSDREGHHWSAKCEILQCCVDKKRLDFCSECDDFPCKIIEEWIGGMEHHMSAIERLGEMKGTGVEKSMDTAKDKGNKR